MLKSVSDKVGDRSYVISLVQELSSSENLAKLTGKHLCRGFFINKAAGLTPQILLMWQT